MTDKEVARQNFMQMRQAHAVAQGAKVKRTDDLALKLRLKSFLSEFSGPVMAYRPLPSEADPFPETVNADWVYPRIDGVDMMACSVKSDQDFHRSSFGVLEPSSNCAAVAAATLSLVLIPGLAFDRHGNRLGFGKGHYDRFLKKTSPRTQRVGVGYSFQVSPEGLPKDEWDERVDWILTERYVLNVQRKD